MLDAQAVSPGCPCRMPCGPESVYVEYFRQLGLQQPFTAALLYSDQAARAHKAPFPESLPACCMRLKKALATCARSAPRCVSQQSVGCLYCAAGAAAGVAAGVAGEARRQCAAGLGRLELRAQAAEERLERSAAEAAARAYYIAGALVGESGGRLS